MLPRIADPRQSIDSIEFHDGGTKLAPVFIFRRSLKFFFFFFFSLFFSSPRKNRRCLIGIYCSSTSRAALDFEVACQFNWLCKRLLAKHTTSRACTGEKCPEADLSRESLSRAGGKTRENWITIRVSANEGHGINNNLFYPVEIPVRET